MILTLAVELAPVCHRPDGLEVVVGVINLHHNVCHRPDGLEEPNKQPVHLICVCHRPDGLEESII